MNETSLVIARKVILCLGLLAATLLFLYPHWRMSVDVGNGNPAYDLHIGRAFIASKPGAGVESQQFQEMAGLSAVVRIDHGRQVTEVAITLLFTFVLAWALRNPAPPNSETVQEKPDKAEKKARKIETPCI